MIARPDRRRVLALLAGATVAACARGGREPVVTPLVYPNPPIALSVDDVEVVPAYQSPRAAPYVEHLFPVPPADAARAWAMQQLNATGGPSHARFIIAEASAKETKLYVTGGVTGAFKREPSERYDVVIDVRLEISGAGSGFVRARAEVSGTVIEGTEPWQRREAWHNLTRRAMGDLDATLQREIRVNLAAYIR